MTNIPLKAITALNNEWLNSTMDLNKLALNPYKGTSAFRSLRVYSRGSRRHNLI